MSFIISILQYLQHERCFKQKKLKRKLRKLTGIRKKTPRKPILPPRNHGPHRYRRVEEEDIYEATGLFEDAFEWVFQQVKDLITLPRNFFLQHSPIIKYPTMLEPRTRLLLVLQYLRHYPKFSVLQNKFDVSKSYITREINHIIPILYTKINLIHWPTDWVAEGRFGTHGAIDGTAHYRWRVHPGQANYFRGDKHAHMLSAQVNYKCKVV